MPRWTRPPQLDETGRLTPEARAQARRRVLRSLLALVLVVIATGLLAYGCSRAGSNGSLTPSPSPTVSPSHERSP